ENGKITSFRAGQDVPIDAIRGLAEDSEHHLYAVGWTGVARFEHGNFVSVADKRVFGNNLPQGMILDRQQGMWVLGTKGLVHHKQDGKTEVYRAREGLSDAFGINVALEDHDGNIWVGTDNGLARLENGRFRTRIEPGLQTRASVSALFEDREGNLWVGSGAGLVRLRDDAFTVYGKPEGLQSDEPDVIFQDHKGDVWAGYSDGGMAVVSGSAPAASMKEKFPKGRVFSIRESRSHELLVAAREGLVRIEDGLVRTYIPVDPLGRKTVYDVLESADGRLWLALPNGLATLKGAELRMIVHAGTSRNAYPAALAESRDGSLWAGTDGKGLWHIEGPEGHETTHLYSTADGLGSDSIRSLYEDSAGTLWIGTLGGGLSAYRNGKFRTISAKDGLPSDNITNIIDDGHSLWLTTPRGISTVSKQQLEEFADRKTRALQPVTYGLADGLRSADTPMLGRGGTRNTDGSIWFATNGGIAVFRPGASRSPELPPPVHILGIQAGEHAIELGSDVQVEPTWGSPTIRYSAIHLSAPYRVQFSHKLDGLDTEWTNAGARRVVSYPGLAHGTYTLHVKARLPDGAETAQTLTFTVLPRYYETMWFRLLCLSVIAGAVWAIYRFRVRQVRDRFQSVLDERARLAREVHDTLAQAFVGISTQLAVVDSYMPPEDSPGRNSLEIARRMAQHSLTEARRSVVDLRAAALDELDLGGAIKVGAHQWVAGSGVEVNVEVVGDAASLPENVAHHVLRIAQEAVNNTVKHAHARAVQLTLRVEAKLLELRVTDDGCGFEPEGMLVSSEGNFGLMGMRERAERLRGDFNLRSSPGHGTELTVTVPLST
ncbi:MAG: two-component regulator propeller domain-containing protein, partial [Acidobacteriota bacterium]